MAIFVPPFDLSRKLGETVRSQAATVRALLAEVEQRVGESEMKRALSSAILVNGRNIHYLKGADTPLGAEDEVWMVFPSAGG